MATSGAFSRDTRATILFVDDDADTRFAYQSLATNEGFNADVAGDGNEAVMLANVVSPDIVVLDLRLPGLDGFEVIKRLRASPFTRAIPIIVVTGDDSYRARAAVRQSGCEGHLVKPCSPETLLELIRHLLFDRPGLAKWGQQNNAG